MSSGYQRSLQASIRLANEVVLTPLLTSPALDKLLGCNLFVKAENLQRTGSFKFRGAYNKLSSLNEDERECGVVTFSSGNHAQAVAFAAQLFKCDAKILMPSDSPRIKVENTKLYGGEVIFYDRDKDDRIALAREMAENFGATLIPPFDDTEIMAGQGTIAIEFINQFRERGIEVDVVLVCCSGGGLASGILEVCAEAAPGAVVHTVEPEGFDDMRRSLELGYRVANEKATGSICDALLTTMPGVLTFAALNEGKSKNIAGEGLVVTDEEVKHAMRVAFQQFKIVLEPGGAAALAAALYNKVDLKGKNVVVVASGGNVDASLFAEIITGPSR